MTKKIVTISRRGSVVYVVTSETGAITEVSGRKYTLRTVGYQVEGEKDDNIFEPGENIVIHSLAVVNTGGMTLPAGARVSFPSTDCFLSENDEFILPNIAPGESLTIPTTFRGRIFDVPEPLHPGPFLGYATFYSKADLLNRPFENAVITTQLVVQYPICIRELKSPNHVRHKITYKG